MIGKLLGNRYRIVEKVGEGGMALVYKAECSLLRRPVAIKVLRSQYANDLEFVDRFRREAQAAASLSHPNVVNIYDVGQEDGIDYIVMEYVAGDNLKDLIRKEAPFTLRRALSIAGQICEALNHAHRHNIIHRDIKPHNILITTEGRVKVTDFGIARAVSASGLTQTGVVLGSVQYFSPEQAQGGVVGTQSDIYSLGCVLYEMLTGKVPFSGESPIGIALKHIQEDIVPVERIRPEIPHVVSRIVSKALAKPLPSRYPTAYAMLREIHSALGGEALLDDGLESEDFPTQTLMAVTPVTLKKKKQAWKWLLGIGITLAAIAFFAVIGSLLVNPPPAVKVPNLKGLSLMEANSLVRERKLSLRVVRRVYHSQIGVGRIISQEPSANRELRPGREVRVVVSLGWEMVKVPDVVGKTQFDAELALEGSRLRLGDVYTEPSATVPKGYVARQRPEAETKIQKGARIDLYVSLGPDIDTVKVPNFIGRPLAEVQAELAGLGLVFNRTTSEVSAFPEGQILDQQPAPGSVVPLGTAVSFVISSGSNAQTQGSVQGSRLAQIQVEVDPGPAEQIVKVVVSDNRGRRTVYRRAHRPGERVAVPVRVFGEAKATVYLDDQFKAEEVLD